MNTLHFFIIFTLLSVGTALPAYADRSNDRRSASEAAAFQERGRSAARWASAMSEDRGFTEERRHEEADDRHERGDRHDDDDDDRHEEEQPRRPKARLRLENLTRDRDAPNWIRLDARRSRGRHTEIAHYEYAVAKISRKREHPQEIQAPGPTQSSVAHVLLHPGRYSASVTVTDEAGASQTTTRRLHIRGKTSTVGRHNRVEWALGADWETGDPSLTINHALAPLDIQAFVDIFAEESQALGASSAGCGSTLTDAGNGINVATGFLSIIPGAGVVLGPINAGAATMKIVGGHRSSACTQSQIDAINEELKYQENQIRDIYNIIGIDQQIFMKALISLENQVVSLNETIYADQRKSLASLFQEFMTGAGVFWDDPATPSQDNVARQGVTVEELADETGLGSPMVLLQSFVSARSADVKPLVDSLSGSRIPPDSMTPYKDIQPLTTDLSSSSEPSSILNLFDAFADHLSLNLKNCLMDDGNPCDLGSTPVNILSLYDQYNSTLVAYYLQSLYGLMQAFAMEWYINQFNQFAPLNGEKYVPVMSISKTYGTWYDPRYPNPAPNTQSGQRAYNRAQARLALAYVARANRLYLNTLNYIVTDVPIPNQQAYPEPTPGRTPTGGLITVVILPDPPRIDYATEVGSKLISSRPATLKRTPIAQVTEKTGQHTDSPDGYNWTSTSALYQFSIQDIYKCTAALKRFNESTQFGDIRDAFANLDDCPSVFSLSNNSPVTGGYYDGQMLQPYSFAVSPGDMSHCPAACLAPNCPSGEPPPPDDPGYADWVVGGQGLVRPPTLPSENWNSATPITDNGSWRDSCVHNSATFSGNAGDFDDPPKLCAQCPDTTGRRWNSCATCSSAHWGNRDGTLFCEEDDTLPEMCRGFCSAENGCGDYNYAVDSFEDCTQCGGWAELALSAPMSGNIGFCSNDDPANSAYLCAAGEGESCACHGVVYYGKKFTTTDAPGSGSIASLDDMLNSLQYADLNVAGVVECSNSVFDDPAFGYYKQCYCSGDGNQMSWYQLPDGYTGNTAALQPSATYLSCGNWKTADTVAEALTTEEVPHSYTIPVSNDLALADQDGIGSRSVASGFASCGGPNLDGRITCVGNWAHMSGPFCAWDEDYRSGVNENNTMAGTAPNSCGDLYFNGMDASSGDTYYAGFQIRVPNAATGLRSGGLSLQFALLKQNGRTNLIAVEPLKIDNIEQDITQSGYLCSAVGFGQDDGGFYDDLSCSLMDGREFQMKISYVNTGSDSFARGAFITPTQTNVGCPSGCYECNPGTNGATPGGMDLINGLVCNGFCSGANNCGGANYNQYDSGGDFAPLDCRQCN